MKFRYLYINVYPLHDKITLGQYLKLISKRKLKKFVIEELKSVSLKFLNGKLNKIKNVCPNMYNIIEEPSNPFI